MGAIIQIVLGKADLLGRVGRWRRGFYCGRSRRVECTELERGHAGSGDERRRAPFELCVLPAGGKAFVYGVRRTVELEIVERVGKEIAHRSPGAVDGFKASQAA